MLSVADYLTLPIEAANERHPYGDDDNQFVDIFLPGRVVSPTPVLILVHGGCWEAEFGLEPMGQFARDLSRAGLVVCSLEYRRLGGGGGWPHTFFDVAAAVDSLTTVAKRLPLDLNQVVVAGHSAGGHLALWLAARQRLPADSVLFTGNPLPIQAVVSLAGIPDLETAAARAICQSSPQDLMGGPAAVVPERYAAGSPVELLPLGVPQLHITGADDPIVPAAYVSDFVAAAREAGDQAEHHIVSGAGHFDIVAAGTAVWPQVRQVILAQFPKRQEP